MDEAHRITTRTWPSIEGRNTVKFTSKYPKSKIHSTNQTARLEHINRKHNASRPKTQPKQQLHHPGHPHQASYLPREQPKEAQAVSTHKQPKHKSRKRKNTLFKPNPANPHLSYHLHLQILRQHLWILRHRNQRRHRPRGNISLVIPTILLLNNAPNLRLRLVLRGGGIRVLTN